MDLLLLFKILFWILPFLSFIILNLVLVGFSGSISEITIKSISLYKLLSPLAMEP